LPIQIALFRGINVGGRNLLPMKDCVSIFQKLGFESVKSYIQSGNIIFGSSKSCGKKDIENIKLATLRSKGFEPAVLILPLTQFRIAMEKNPFPTNNGKALHLYFAQSRIQSPNIEKLDQLKIASEKFHIEDHTAYLYTPNGYGKSKLATTMEKALGVAATARNWNSVDKIYQIAVAMNSD